MTQHQNPRPETKAAGKELGQWAGRTGRGERETELTGIALRGLRVCKKLLHAECVQNAGVVGLRSRRRAPEPAFARRLRSPMGLLIGIQKIRVPGPISGFPKCPQFSRMFPTLSYLLPTTSRMLPRISPHVLTLCSRIAPGCFPQAAPASQSPLEPCPRERPGAPRLGPN